MPLLTKVQLLQGSYVGVTSSGACVRLDTQFSSHVFIRHAREADRGRVDIKSYLERVAKASRNNYYLLPDENNFACPLRSDVAHENIPNMPAVRVAGKNGLIEIMPYAIFIRR